jgi:hypothetical protein
MSERHDESQILIEALAAEARTAAGEHPAVEVLAEYRDGDIDGAMANEIQAHLVGCRRCAQALLDLEDLAAAASRPRSQVADFETTAAFRAFKERLDWKRPSPIFRRWRQSAAAVAAALLVAVIGQSAWIAHLRSANRGLRHSLAAAIAPRVNPQSLHIMGGLRGDSSGEIVELSLDQPYVLVAIALDVDSTGDRYTVEITDSKGRVTWTDGGVELTDSTLRVLLPRDRLPEGRCRFRVLSQTAGGDEILLDTPRRIRYQ